MPIRPLPILATALLATATQLGCEDASARRAADAQVTIDEASRSLRYAVLAPPPADDPEAIATTRSALQKVASSLTGVSETPGQEAAAALLVSTAKRELATIGLAEAETLAATHRRQREIVHGQIDAALRLDTLATTLERQVGGPHKTSLASARTDVSGRIQDLSRRIAELDGPIADRESQNRDERVMIAQLDGQAAQLRRQASEVGHLAGLPTFEEAVRIEREADKYESQIAHRENDLQFDLRPEHELASTRVGFLQSMLNEIRSSEVALDARNEMRSTQVQQTRQAVNAYRNEIQTTLSEMQNAWTDTLLPQYESALEHANAAVSQAKRASSKGPRDERDAVRLALARAHELAANVHTSRARELAGQRLLLERLGAAGNTFGRGADYARTADELRAAEEEAIGQAEAELQSAREELEQVGSRDAAAEVSAFRAGLDERLQKITARSSEPALP
ncbi:MAG: hypothetical protein KJO43_10910, partial [Phycisphaerae bacterium]|nr:hypothetical protein [Phycisphaerae bacterium]